jgi:hypothetical protein
MSNGISVRQSKATATFLLIRSSGFTPRTTPLKAVKIMAKTSDPQKNKDSKATVPQPWSVGPRLSCWYTNRKNPGIAVGMAQSTAHTVMNAFFTISRIAVHQDKKRTLIDYKHTLLIFFISISSPASLKHLLYSLLAFFASVSLLQTLREACSQFAFITEPCACVGTIVGRKRRKRLYCIITFFFIRKHLGDSLDMFTNAFLHLLCVRGFQPVES